MKMKIWMNKIQKKQQAYYFLANSSAWESISDVVSSSDWSLWVIAIAAFIAASISLADMSSVSLWSSFDDAFVANLSAIANDSGVRVPCCSSWFDDFLATFIAALTVAGVNLSWWSLKVLLI